jgi:hypothetical protein
MAVKLLLGLLAGMLSEPPGEPRAQAGPGPWEMAKDPADYALWRLPLGPVPEEARFVDLEVRFPEGTLFSVWLREASPAGEAWLAGLSDGAFSGGWEGHRYGIGPFPGHRAWSPRGEAELLTFPAAECDDRKTPRSATRLPLGNNQLERSKLAYVEFEFPATNGWSGPPRHASYGVRSVRFLAQRPFEQRAAGEPVQVTVDCSQDLGPVNPLWKDACLTSKSFQALGQRMYKVFGAATFGPSYAPQDGPTGRYSWFGVNAQMRLAQQSAPVIQVVIGRDAPRWLWPAADGAASLAGSMGPWKVGHLLPPRDMTAYEEIVYELARHIREDLGLRVHSYLVWNGANSTGYFRGTMDQYGEVYAACARAVKRADPEAKVGGPSPDPEFEPDWPRALIDYCAAHDLPLDFVSLHNYSLYPRKSRQAALWTRTLLQQHPQFRGTEVHFDEWNSGFGLGPLFLDVKRSALNAAYAAASFGEMTEGGVAYACYASPSEGWGLLNVRLEEDDGTPRPIGNAFRLFNRLKGRRVEARVAPGDLAIGALAAQEGETTRVALWGYAPEQQPTDPPVPLPVEVTLTGLPGPDGERTVRLWCVDEAHSNRAAGKQHADLEALPEQRLRVTSGRASMELTVKVPSVLLVEL